MESIKEMMGSMKSIRGRSLKEMSLRVIEEEDGGKREGG